MHWLVDNKTNMVLVLSAIKAIAYPFKESYETRTLIFKSIEIKPSIEVSSLFLDVLGNFDGNKNLIDLLLKKLKTYD